MICTRGRSSRQRLRFHIISNLQSRLSRTKMYSWPYSPRSQFPMKTLRRRHDSCSELQLPLQSGPKNGKLISTQTNQHTSYLVPGILRVNLQNENIETKDCVRYLGLHMDKSLTWKDHIKKKKRQFNHKMKSMYLILGRKSNLTLQYNNIMNYSYTRSPLFQFGHNSTQLWECAKKSNINIIQWFQNKAN